jgi:peptide/nickel transport system ATP-binding protein
MAMMVLSLDNLKISYRTANGREAVAVDGVSLSIEEGEYLGLVGESGCGKSTIAKAILGILPPSARVTGSIRYRQQELIAMAPSKMREIRWRDIALIPQTAMNGFDPVYTIEHQIAEAIAAHEKMPKPARQARAAELFAMVGLPQARLKDYPHQFSGGMRQRAMIAMAFALSPKLVVADEPTTGLDVIVQDQILSRIGEIGAREPHAMLLITHDMALVSENCGRIAVMYAGKIVELGGAEVFEAPLHPYTMGLVNAFPSLHPQGEGEISDLVSIPGTPPSLIDPPAGCRFRERCPFAAPVCTTEPKLTETAPGRFAACHFAGQAHELRTQARDPLTWQGSRAQHG